MIVGQGFYVAVFGRTDFPEVVMLNETVANSSTGFRIDLEGLVGPDAAEVYKSYLSEVRDLGCE